MGIEDFITVQRMDPIVTPGTIAPHAHAALGGSNFAFNTNTASLRQSQCTSIPIPEDKSNYWFPHLYFQWNNGSFTSLTGGAVIYYLFSSTPGSTTAFPDDFRMVSGTPTLRTYNASNFAQRAVTFLCLNFNGKSVTYNSLPPTTCPNGIRAQINFPSCWDGKNVDSPDHKSHVAFLSEGPDQGTCNDPKYPVVLPRIFMEVYWDSNAFDGVRSQAMNSTQPFVYAMGDPTGYGYHADFINGWDEGVLQRAVDGCTCNNFGDFSCCVEKGLFHSTQGQQCYITPSIDEQTTGTLLKLPGNNPVQPEGKTAISYPDDLTPPLIAPVYAYTGNLPTATGHIVTPRQTNPDASPVAPATTSTPAPPKASSSSHTTAAVRSTPAAPAKPPAPKSDVLVDVPTASHSTQPQPPAAPATTSPSTSESDPPLTCQTPKRRLNYHRRHSRSSHAGRHDFFLRSHEFRNID
jgi:hypothetical protein